MRRQVLPLRRALHFGEVAEWSNAPDSKSGLRYCRNVGSNPTLSARHEKGPIGPFFMSVEGGGVDESTRATRSILDRALRAVGCADVRLRHPAFAVDKFVWNKFGQPKAGSERSEGRGAWMRRAIPPSPPDTTKGPFGPFVMSAI